MPVTKKTYIPLIELPTVLILNCSQVLPNRMQCWKAGDYLVEEELPAPTPPVDSGANTGTPEASMHSYQLCAMHATIQQRADALAAQEEAAGKTQPDPSDPKSIHSKMMQAQGKVQTTTPPSGEKAAQR